LSRGSHTETREFREKNLRADLPELPVNDVAVVHRETREFRERDLLPDLSDPSVNGAGVVPNPSDSGVKCDGRDHKT